MRRKTDYRYLKLFFFVIKDPDLEPDPDSSVGYGSGQKSSGSATLQVSAVIVHKITSVTFQD